MAQNVTRIRRSLRELELEYEKGNTKPLENLFRAWKGIKELKFDDPRSLFILGGYHGEPFRGAGWGLSTFWGGYCNHGNILFPTWHRVYCLKVEDALRSIPGCEEVTLPYWDETDADSIAYGIPWSLTVKDVTLDAAVIANPLRSFIFPITITDNVSTDNGLYTKAAGYETKRYPLSGLVGTEEARKATDKHNSQFPDYKKNVDILNENIKGWLDGTVTLPPDNKPLKTGILEEFIMCLDAPNYTVFSNTTSAQQWNQLHDGDKVVMPLEQPHNDIHLAVGGFDVPNQGDFSHIEGANGDMGENDTAALDPIFFFHHCNIDRVFWLWQKRHGFTDRLEIIAGYPGTNTSDNQGATPGVPANSWLDLNTPLTPFTDATGRSYISQDCINIESQMGYTYTEGSLEKKSASVPVLAAGTPAKKLCVSKINRAPIAGSFVISAYATIEGEKYYLGSRSVLSRWAVTGCANCQTHLEVKAFFDLEVLQASNLEDADYHIEIDGRSQSAPVLAAVVSQSKYQLEVR